MDLCCKTLTTHRVNACELSQADCSNEGQNKDVGEEHQPLRPTMPSGMANTPLVSNCTIPDTKVSWANFIAKLSYHVNTLSHDSLWPTYMYMYTCSILCTVYKKVEWNIHNLIG